MELKIVLEEVLAAFPNLRMQPGTNYEYHTVGVWGVEALPVEWSPN
jgi:cytochrome P450